MIGEWCYMNNCFTSEECDEIVKLGLSQKLEEGKLGAKGSFVDTSYRKSKRAFLNSGIDSSALPNFNKRAPLLIFASGWSGAALKHSS